jgi:hypothetical protein
MGDCTRFFVEDWIVATLSGGSAALRASAELAIECQNGTDARQPGQ